MTIVSRRRFLTRMLAAPALLTVPLSASGQAGQRYRIELVVFEHLGYDSRLFLERTARPLQPQISGFGIGEGPIRPSEGGFQLQHVADRVERSGQGRVLARLAWDQIGRDYRIAPWIRIQEGRYLGAWLGDAPAAVVAPDEGGLRTVNPELERYELEGRLRIWVGHFLHLETDLLFRSVYADAENVSERVPAVRVRGSQRMNSGEELFYLDHPVVGIIARVTRLSG